MGGIRTRKAIKGAAGPELLHPLALTYPFKLAAIPYDFFFFFFLMTMKSRLSFVFGDIDRI